MHCCSGALSKVLLHRLHLVAGGLWGSGNLEVLVSVEGGNPEKPEKNPRSKDENKQQTQPTYDAGP